MSSWLIVGLILDIASVPDFPLYLNPAKEKGLDDGLIMQ